MKLEETVRRMIGLSGPQHPSKEDYESYIDERLEHMPRSEFLFYLSLAMEETNDRG